MGNKLELLGKKFGRLTVIQEYGKDKNGKVLWECQCDCGNKTVSLGSNLVRGKSLSCGCLKNELTSKRMKKHGMRSTKIYKKWQGMKRRCYEKENRQYKNYGGRGIIICDEWLGEHGFENFYSWAMRNGYRDGLSIERKNVNGDYCPENCCWIPLPEQSRNKTNTKRISDSVIAVDLARKNGTCLSTMYGRMRKGMTPEENVINKNLKSKQIEKIDINTDDVICTYKSLRQAAKALGKNPSDISLCANGRLKTAYGYKWRFGNE